MMRVLMTADTIGSVMTYATTLASQLCARGHKVDLAVLGPPMREAQRDAAQSVRGLTLHVLDCALEWMDDAWLDLDRSAKWLLALEKRVRPDVVHVNGYAHAAAGFRGPVVVGAHSCMLSWWRAVHREEAPPLYDRYRRDVVRGLAAARAVIAPSRAMLACLAREYDYDRGVTVPNGAPVPQRKSHKEPFVLSCGRLWDRAKNVEAVERVARNLAWPLTLAGCGAEDDGIEHLGWLPHAELEEVMDRAAIVALPALYEPFGLCALEAALRSCALVLGDIESQHEIWDDAAIFIDPRNDDDIARAIKELIADDVLRAKMGERAYRHALAYSPARMASATLAVYASVLERGAVQCAL